jgi:hypothetical protein
MAEAEFTPSEWRRLQRRAFIQLGGMGLVGLGGWWWLRAQGEHEGLLWPLRRMHEVNEQLGRAVFNPRRLAPEFAPVFAGTPRPNGRHGRPRDYPDTWTIDWVTPHGTQQFTVAELLANGQRVTMTTELKCIEGWSQVVTWSGVRFADVAGQFRLHHGSYPYILFATPDGSYTAAFDSPSAFHPQTLLCDEMNGEPLEPQHGAPLRVVTTVKYGIKNIKWLGRVEFSHTRPLDYWTNQGYDWYAGL